MSSLWRRTSSRMLVTGYLVTLTNETGMTTRQVKFGINDYLAAEVGEVKGSSRWVLVLYHGTTIVERSIKSSESAAKQAAKKWLKKKLCALRAEYAQVERNVIAECTGRGYVLAAGEYPS